VNFFHSLMVQAISCWKESMDWTAISDAIRTLDWATLSDIAVVVSAIFVVRQLIEMRRTTQAQAYTLAVNHLQSEEVRQARRIVFQLDGKPLESWSKKEKDAAEIVCHTYDAVGQMVRHRLLSKKIIVDSWGPSLRRSWPILWPLVQKYRQEFDAIETWDDYEWLANEANEAKKRREAKERRVGWYCGRKYS
jgi:hypothetical protein